MKTIHKVRAVVTDRKGRVYMIEAMNPRRIQLPGGGIKSGENLKAAVLREVAEETGFTKARILSVSKPVTVRREKGGKETSVCFHVRVAGRRRQPTLTGRERAKGLHVTRYDTVKAARRELKRRFRTYRRSAVGREISLMKAVLS